MKYLKRIFENTSNELPDDIQDAILGIEDELGQPKISKKTINNVTKYELMWKALGYLPSFEKFIEKIEKMCKIKHEIASIKGRLSKNYETDFLYDSDGEMYIFIETKLTPFEYEFIKKIDEEKKIVHLNKSEILRFFSANLVQVRKMEHSSPRGPRGGIRSKDLDRKEVNDGEPFGPALKITLGGDYQINYTKFDLFEKSIYEILKRSPYLNQYECMVYRFYRQNIFFVCLVDGQYNYYEINLS